MQPRSDARVRFGTVAKPAAATERPKPIHLPQSLGVPGLGRFETIGLTLGEVCKPRMVYKSNRADGLHLFFLSMPLAGRVDCQGISNCWI